jgi:hypothetical protein
MNLETKATADQYKIYLKTVVKKQMESQLLSVQ